MSSEIAKKLREWCTDWNGAAMVRGEPPRDGLHCDILLDAAAEIERLAEIEELFDEIQSAAEDHRGD